MDLPSPSVTEVRGALAAVREVLFPSPLTLSPILSERLGARVYLKWENRFKTGSFKERGAVHVLSQLSKEKKARGVCAASAGNHALALSYHSQQSGVACRVVMPCHAPFVKVETTRQFGAEVILHGSSFDEAYAHAEELAARDGLEFVSAFDDPRIIAGQGTCGLEILEELPEVDTIFVPVGGGGLACGIGLAVKAAKPGCAVIGVRSEWAEAHRGAACATRCVPLADVSIADGIAVKNPGRYTTPLLPQVTDRVVQVTEQSIARAMVALLETERVVVEGAGAAGLAALQETPLPDSASQVVVVITGSNIDINFLARIIAWDQGERGRLLRLTVSVPDRPGSLSYLTATIAEAGANILEVSHERSFSQIPGNVDISFLVEVRGHEHAQTVRFLLRDRGLTVL